MIQNCPLLQFKSIHDCRHEHYIRHLNISLYYHFLQLFLHIFIDYLNFVLGTRVIYPYSELEKFEYRSCFQVGYIFVIVQLFPTEQHLAHIPFQEWCLVSLSNGKLFDTENFFVFAIIVSFDFQPSIEMRVNILLPLTKDSRLYDDMQSSDNKKGQDDPESARMFSTNVLTIFNKFIVKHSDLYSSIIRSHCLVMMLVKNYPYKIYTLFVHYNMYVSLHVHNIYKIRTLVSIQSR